MAGFPPKKATAFSFEVTLVSQTDTDIFKTTVTLAAGDIQVSKDGAQYANLATFPPSEILLAGGGNSGTLLVTLTALEMTADRIAVLFHDQAGNEWQDLIVEIFTDTAQVSSAVLGATQGAITWGQQKIVANVANEGALDIRNANADGIGTYNNGGDVGLYNDGTALYGQYNVGADTGLYNNGTGVGGYGNYNVGIAIGQYNVGSGGASSGQANDGVVQGQYNIGGSYGTLNAGGTDGLNCTGTANAGIQATGAQDGILATGTAGYGENITGGTAALNPEYAAAFFSVDSTETSATAVEGSVVKEIMDGLCTPTVFPAGAINFTYTITDSVTTLPIEGVEVWISTDNPAVNIVWKGDTDAFGVARDVNGDLPALDVGVYNFWRQKAGYTFSDPDVETVS